MFKMLRAYRRGMAMIGRVTLPAVLEECREFCEEPSVEELCDVLHGTLRFVGLGVLVWPTARKHALRVITRGCPRSERNCLAAGKDCCCGGR